MTAPRTPSETIARELEALGEEPLDADELAMLEAERIDDEPAVASTALLIELLDPPDHPRPVESPGLSEFERQRVWRTIEARRGSAAGDRASRRWAPWVGIGVALAVAAAVTMLVVLPSDERKAGEPPGASEVAEVGEQARSVLRSLDDGLGDTARAERLTADYRSRLEATR